MIDLDLNLVINTEKTSNNKLDLKNFANNQNSFAKVFEDASKSFEATKKSMENNNKSVTNKNIETDKPKITKKENNKQKISDNNKNESKKDNNISDKEENNSSKEIVSNEEKLNKEENNSKIENNESNKNNEDNQPEQNKETTDNTDNNEDKITKNEEISEETVEDIIHWINSENTESDINLENTEESEHVEKILLSNNAENETNTDNENNTDESNTDENINQIVEDYRKLDDKELSVIKKLETLNRVIFSGKTEQQPEKTNEVKVLADNKDVPETKVESEKTNLTSDLLKTTENNLPKENVNVLAQTQETPETQKTKEPNLLERLLFGKRQEVDNNKVTEKTAQEAKDTSDKLLNERVQASDLKDKVVEELKAADSKLLTQNPIKTLNSPENVFKGHSEFLVKNDRILNLQNVINPALKSEPQTTLSDVMTELDIDVDVKVDNVQSSLENQLSQNSNQNEFNFNSSSFTDLNSHVTKLSLNKTADFSKVMNTKTSVQDNQILNQVKEATANTLTKGTTNVSIILRPENLGRVHVNLVSQNGVLTAHLTAQTQQTADALNRNIETLRQNLIDQGVKVAEVSVKVQETSNSDGLMNDNQSFEDKLGQTKEQYQSSKHNHRNKFDSDFENKHNDYSRNNSSDEEDNETLTSHHNSNNNRNNNLGLYNNMGRTL